MNRINQVVPEFERRFGHVLQGRYAVYFPESRRELFIVVGGQLPDWGGAAYIPGRKRIVVKQPQWSDHRFQLDKEVTHELSHLFTAEKFPAGSLPLWFNEGLAEYWSGQHIDIEKGTILANALFTKRFIPLTHIDSLLQFSGPRARLAYAEGLSAVLFLENRFLEKEGITGFLNRIEQSNFTDALHETTGMDFIDFELNWFRWVQRKYKWFVVFNLENLIWVAMVIVLAGALYAIRYRNRRILQDWEKEEMMVEEWIPPDEENTMH